MSNTPPVDRRSGEDRRTGLDPEDLDALRRELGQLAATAGAQVSALEDIGADIAQSLTVAVNGLTAAISSMATKDEVVASEANQDRKRRWVVLGVAIGFFLLTVATVAGTVAVLRLNSVADQNRANGRYLVECTTPSPAEDDAVLDEADRVHECFEEGQARQAVAIADLSALTMEAAICASSFPGQETVIRECFSDRLKALQAAKAADE